MKVGGAPGQVGGADKDAPVPAGGGKLAPPYPPGTPCVIDLCEYMAGPPITGGCCKGGLSDPPGCIVVGPPPG